MRLFEAILDANHRAAAGDAGAGLHPAEFADALPLIALTCIDPRLNPLMPEVLGIPENQFIWLRNAGNIVTSPTSSTLRSLALACAVKGGREIAVIGHTDCLVCKHSMLELLERFKALGVERPRLPENIIEAFGLFSSERQNVLRGVDFIRASPFIGPGVPVHGLLVNTATGHLEWLVNGYQALGGATAGTAPARPGAAESFDALKELLPFHLGEMKFPEGKIGEVAAKLEHMAPKLQEAAQKIGSLAAHVGDFAGKAGQWLAEVRVPDEGPPSAPAPRIKMVKPSPKPPPMPPPHRPPRKH